MIPTPTKIHKVNTRKLRNAKRQEELNHRVDYLAAQILYYFKPITLEQLYNRKEGSDARNILYKVLRDSGSTYAEIGVAFNKKHHTTVINSLRRFNQKRRVILNATYSLKLIKVLSIIKRLNKEYILKK